MPDLLDDLRALGGPVDPPSPAARERALIRLQREIDAELATPAAAPRRRRPGRRVVIPVLGVALVLGAAAALVPAGGPGARDVLARAAAAVSAQEPEILTATVHGVQIAGRTQVGDYGVVRLWVRQSPRDGETAFRSLLVETGPELGAKAAAGDETASYRTPDPRPGEYPWTSEDYSARTGKRTVNRGTRSSFAPGIFMARELLEKAERGDDVTVDEGELDGRRVYILRWREDTSRIANRVRIVQTLWVDRETYAPLQMTDHAVGTDAAGRPLDQTYRATISDFERLPDTEEQRRLLELGAAHR